MKKYFFIICLIVVVFVAGMAISVTPIKAQTLTISEFVELLISIGAISPDKVEMARSLATSNSVTPESSPVTTVVPVTVRPPCYRVPVGLEVNTSGPEVVTLQTELINKGFDIPAISSGQASKGYFGSQTAAAFKKYQQSETIHTDCITPPIPFEISEEVKCVFNGATMEQKCSGTGAYTINDSNMEIYPPQFSCSGTESCVMKVSGPKGMKLAWSSSCVENSKMPITTIDGVDEYVNFNCRSDSNKPPVINGLDAPTVLSVGEKGTWTVKASDPENGPLSYSITWGDEYRTATAQDGTSNTLVPQEFTQRASFTHTYYSAGKYTVNITVKDNVGLISQTSATVSVGTVTLSSLTVLSPNGGESWKKGTVQTIKWQDYIHIPYCIPGPACPISVAPSYDIKLARYYPPCTGQICPAYPYTNPDTIAKGVYGLSYRWTVGSISLADDLLDLAQDGSYRIWICQSTTNTCDFSDSYFQISSEGDYTESSTISRNN